MKAILLSISLLGLLSVAYADDLRPGINATSDEVCKALMNRDIGAFKKALAGKVTADFKYYDTPTTKPMSYDQMVSVMGQSLAAMSKVTIATEKLLHAKIEGDTATVLTIHRMTGTLVPGKDGKSHSMSFSGVSTDMYKKVGGTWKFASMTWKSTEQKMDGHRIKAGM